MEECRGAPLSSTNMEVDSRAIEERKERDGDAVMAVTESISGRQSDFSAAAADGQSYAGKGCTTLYKLKLALIDALLGCVLLCVGAAWVTSGSTARKDASGWPACELCGGDSSLSYLYHQ